MSVLLHHRRDLGYLEVQLTGKVTRHDYEKNIPQIENMIREHGKLRILFELHDFDGWTWGGLWEDLKFDAKHFDDVERLAIVGEKRWHEGMAVVCKPFTTAKIRYFESFEIDEAREWLTRQRPPVPPPAEAATQSPAS